MEANAIIHITNLITTISIEKMLFYLLIGFTVSPSSLYPPFVYAMNMCSYQFCEIRKDYYLPFIEGKLRHREINVKLFKSSKVQVATIENRVFGEC